MKPLHTVSTIAAASVLLLSLAQPTFAAAQAEPAIAKIAVPAVPAGAPDANLLKEAKITKEQAVNLAQQAIAVPEGYTLQSSSLNGSRYPVGGPSWQLNYVKKVKDRFYGNLYVTIDAVTGALLDYNYYDNDPDKKPSYPPKTSYAQAKETAMSWIERIHPETKAELLYDEQNEKSFKPPLNGNVSYDIRYDRVVGGVPYPQNYVAVTVNGDGEVTGFHYVWETEATFEDASGTLSADDAAKAFNRNASAWLSYYKPYQSADKKMYVTYGADTFSLDAKTGEIWVPKGGSAAVSRNSQPLTDKPLAEAPAGNLNLTRDEAIQRVKAAVTLPEGLKLADASFHENNDTDSGKTTYLWNLRWSAADSGDAATSARLPGSDVWATVDSKTGELINFSKNSIVYDSQTAKEQVANKLSQEEAKQAAVEFVKKTAPAYTDQLVLQQGRGDIAVPLGGKQPHSYSFTFQREIDGVRAGYDSVYVTVDAVKGDVAGYSRNFSNIDYPADKPAVISEEKAKELLLSQFNIRLAYTRDQGNQYFVPLLGAADTSMLKMETMAAAGAGAGAEAVADEGQPDKEKAKKEAAKLVYQLVPKYPSATPYFLDAATGEWRSQETGDVVSLVKATAADIAGHWAENELKLMLDYEALEVKDGKVNPDQSISRGEMIKMLVISMNGGRYGIQVAAGRAESFADVKRESPYFAYVERAVDSGILTRDGSNFNPDAVMTREDMAQLIVRALGYGKLAEKEGLFAVTFDDAAKLKRPGDAALVTGLGLMQAKNGSFVPEAEVTKAEAASAFYRYLQTRFELQDRR